MLDSIKCSFCGNDFLRERKEINRITKLGRLQFCRDKCLELGKRNNGSKEGFPSTLISGNKRDNLTPFRWFLKVIKNGNRKKKECNLLLQDIKDLWEYQNGTCPFTGWKLRLPNSTVGFERPFTTDCASLDRIDSKQGYIKGNVQFVSVMYNYAKNNFQHEDVLKFCAAVQMQRND